MSAGLNDVLAVVREQEDRSALEEFGEHPSQRPTGLFAHAERGGNRLYDEGRVRNGLQFHHPDPIRKLREETVGHLQRQPGLATASRPDQSDQPVGF